MAPKRLDEELFYIHKRARISYGPSAIPHFASSERVEDAPPPSPPYSSLAKSSTTRIQREAVEDFKKSSEFKDLLASIELKDLVEGFYACRGWINHHYPLLDLSRYAFSIIPRKFHFPPPRYLEEAEAAIERRRFEEVAQRVAGLDVPDLEDVSSPVPHL